MTQPLLDEREKLDALLPDEPGLRAHVHRVAALAHAVALQSGFSAEQVRAVERAGLLHHLQSEVTGSPIAARLLADLGFPELLSGSLLPVPADAADIVKIYRGSAEATCAEASEFAAILDSSNLFDEQMENLPYEDENTAVVVTGLLGSGMLAPSFIRALKSFSASAKQPLLAAAKKLPVFPKAAMEALRLVRDPDAGLFEIERALGKDAVLAGEIVRLANSGALGSSVEVNSVAGALARVGTHAAGKMIAMAAARACFVSAKVHDLWKHSCATADSAAWMAEVSKLDVGQAYLAGLVHDVGRLPYELSEAGVHVRKWEKAGFPTVYAEMLISGTDHAELGANILVSWNFPQSIVEAVRFHHRPELVDSKLAAVLYAVEDLDETLPSASRDHQAAKRLEVEELPREHAAS